MTDRLVDVVDRGPRPDGRAGWEDRLACGHTLPFTGAKPKQRRCPACGPVVPTVGESQPSLTIFDFDRG